MTRQGVQAQQGRRRALEGIPSLFGGSARMGRPAREADIEFAGSQKSAHAGDQIAAVRGSQTDMHGQEMPRPRHMGDHGRRTAHAFLGRLEQQTHTPPQGGRARSRQQGRQPQAQSHMAVMGTGMAQAFMPGDEALAHGPVGSLLRFHKRQGVHVAAQHQRQRRVRRAHIGHQARGPAHALQPVWLQPFRQRPLPGPGFDLGRGQAHACGRVDDLLPHTRGKAHVRQLPGHEARGPEFRPTFFRVPVQLPPPLDDLFRRLHRHCLKSTGTRTRCPALLVKSNQPCSSPKR